jgi:hypothetical protein
LFRSKLTAGSDRAIYHACSLAPYFRKLSAK